MKHAISKLMIQNYKLNEIMQYIGRRARRLLLNNGTGVSSSDVSCWVRQGLACFVPPAFTGRSGETNWLSELCKRVNVRNAMTITSISTELTSISTGFEVFVKNLDFRTVVTGVWFVYMGSLPSSVVCLSSSSDSEMLNDRWREGLVWLLQSSTTSRAHTVWSNFFYPCAIFLENSVPFGAKVLQG